MPTMGEWLMDFDLWKSLFRENRRANRRTSSGVSPSIIKLPLHTKEFNLRIVAYRKVFYERAVSIACFHKKLLGFRGKRMGFRGKFFEFDGTKPEFYFTIFDFDGTVFCFGLTKVCFR